MSPPPLAGLNPTVRSQSYLGSTFPICARVYEAVRICVISVAG
jgi:hypothetical protein